MAPNLFLCLRTVFCPIYWFRKGVQFAGPIIQDEHWDEPVPGTYRYVPGHGWHLIRRDNDPTDGHISPEPVVFCELLNCYLLASEMEKRCRVSVISNDEAQLCKYRLFMLDDGITWIAAWDEKDRLIPGPYDKWFFDKESREMRLMGNVDMVKKSCDDRLVDVAQQAFRELPADGHVRPAEPISCHTGDTEISVV